MKIQVGNKTIGELVNGIFTKYVKEKIHLMRSMDAWGIDKRVFDGALQDTIIRIIDDKGVVYTTTSDIYSQYGIVADFGHREQIFLARKYFSTRSPNQMQLI